MKQFLFAPLVAFLLIAESPGQKPAEQDPSPVDVRTLLQELRSSKLTPARRDEVVGHLLGLGDNGATHVFNITRQKYQRLHRDFVSARERHLHAFAVAAQRLLAQKQGRSGAAEIEQLRDKVLAHSRGSAGLDKQVIKSELDPAMARLQELLEVSAGEVLAADDELLAEAGVLKASVLELMEWEHVFEQACDVLAETDRGARRVDGVTLPDPSEYRQELRAAQSAQARAATPMSERDARTLERNAEASVGLDLEEVRGTLELNRTRLLLGIGALALDVKLSEAGRGHSADMVRLGFFAHESPVEGKRTPSQRAALAGTSGGAENIAAGQATGKGAIRAWWYSPGHHKNMLGSHGRVGLGRVEDHWTQMFGG